MQNLILPFEKTYVTTQTFAEHKSWAISHKYCWKPAPGCLKWYYPGIDYGTPVGTRLLASLDGKGTLTSETSGYGWSVKIINDQGYKIVYGHLSKFLIGQGQVVKQGDVIGLSGGAVGDVGSGSSSGAHLHWELRINEIPTDPAPFITQSIPNDVFVGDMIRFTGSPRIRKQPTTLLSNNIIGEVIPQATMEKVEICEIKVIDDIVWGRFDNLWIALEQRGDKYYANN